MIDSSKEAEEIVNPQVVFPVAKDCSAEQFSQKALSARLVSKNDGIQSFKGTESVNVLALNDVNFEENELNAWNLILFKQEVLPEERIKNVSCDMFCSACVAINLSPIFMCFGVNYVVVVAWTLVTKEVPT